MYYDNRLFSGGTVDSLHMYIGMGTVSAGRLDFIPHVHWNGFSS